MVAVSVASVQCETVVSDPVKAKHIRQQKVQQTIVSLLPQSKTGQAAALAKLNPKKRDRDNSTVKSVGLATSMLHTRSRAAVAI